MLFVNESTFNRSTSHLCQYFFNGCIFIFTVTKERPQLWSNGQESYTVMWTPLERWDPHFNSWSIPGCLLVGLVIQLSLQSQTETSVTASFSQRTSNDQICWIIYPKGTGLNSTWKQTIDWAQMCLENKIIFFKPQLAKPSL